METSIHEHCELKSYSIGKIQPVKLIIQYSRWTAVVLSSVTDDAGSWIHHSLQLVCYDSRRLSQHSVTVVDTRCHKCLHEGFSWPHKPNNCRTRWICLRWKKQASLMDETAVVIISVVTFSFLTFSLLLLLSLFSFVSCAVSTLLA